MAKKGCNRSNNFCSKKQGQNKSFFNALAQGGGMDYDDDAQIFFDAYNISEISEKIAINNLVLGYKAFGLWTKKKVIYPFVGSSALKASGNLKNPAQFQITWVGGVTFDSMGVQFNAINAFGDTGFIEANELTLNDEHISFYERTGNIDNGAIIGATGTGGAFQRTTIFPNYNVPPQYTIFDMNSAIDPNGRAIATNGGIAWGHYIGNRIAANNLRVYRNDSEVANALGGNDGTLPDVSLFIGANNNNGGGGDLFSAGELAFASVGIGLTAQEKTNAHVLELAFITALGRNV